MLQIIQKNRSVIIIHKIIIVINGAGGVGKDTLCDFASKYYKVMNVSSVDPIKEAAHILGWHGTKELKDRKFLSDLKKIACEYSDISTEYLLKKYSEFLEGDYEIIFVHIREGSEIDHFKEKVGTTVITLLIRRDDEKTYGNSSDDDVALYQYDYVYDNNYSLEESEVQFLRYLNTIKGRVKRGITDEK